MLYALITLAVVVVALIAERHDMSRRRDIETAEWRRLVVRLVEQPVEERANLLQRIQAPEQAVIEHSTAKRPAGPLYVNEFTDEQDEIEEIMAAQALANGVE